VGLRIRGAQPENAVQRHGFSKPIRIVFALLFKQSRETRVTGDLQYHPESISHTTSSESIFEKYVYEPVYKRIKLFSKRIKFLVQTGSVHSYLLYIFAALIILMAYNRLAG
jgi:hypothetical protein